MIAGAMRTQFERAGVWGLMRKRIAASMYTLPGDPMKIDCGYRPNGVVKMFHAVSLDGDVEAAKVLAYSAHGLREGVLRVEGARLELTAVVEPCAPYRMRMRRSMSLKRRAWCVTGLAWSTWKARDSGTDDERSGACRADSKSRPSALKKA